MASYCSTALINNACVFPCKRAFIEKAERVRHAEFFARVVHHRRGETRVAADDDLDVGPALADPRDDQPQVVVRAEKPPDTSRGRNPTSTTASVSAQVTAIGKYWYCP